MQPVSEDDINTIVQRLQTQLQSPKPNQKKSFIYSKPVQAGLTWWIAIGGIGTVLLWLLIGYVYFAPKPLHNEVKPEEVSL